MQAAWIERYGKGEALKVGEWPRPEPRPDEVLVAVRAASVNPRDWLIREGRYPLQFLLPALPFVLGSDVSGVVEEVGRRVEGFRPGDEVFAMQPSSRGFGAYAEYVAVKADAVAPKPPNVTHEEAAGVPLAALTARQALLQNGRLRSGQKVLVIGASGGVGHFAVQIARAHGARVTGVCSTANVELVRSLGAERVIDYKRESFLAPADGAPDVYDVVFDTIGRESLASCAPVLSSAGVYVTTVPSPRTFWTVLTSTVRSWLTRRNRRRASVVAVRASGAQLRELGRLIAAEELRTHVDAVYPLAEVQAAHAHSRTFRTRGKLILRVG